MTHITDFHRANLFTLAVFLSDHADVLNFTMATFSRTESYIDTNNPHVAPQDLEHACGTVGCALGWAPAAGITPLEDQTDFWTYAQHFFGASDKDSDYPEGQPIWDSFFSHHWSKYDATAKGAADRIKHFLTTGELIQFSDCGEDNDDYWGDDDDDDVVA